MIPMESRTFHIGNHMATAFQMMADLRRHEQLCDITLRVDAHSFMAHRVILASCSPYFRAMFTDGLLETRKNMITLHDIEASTLALLLDFMYTGSIELTIENVQSVLQGACMFNLSALNNICCQFLELHLDVSNCLGIQIFADTYSCMELEAVSRRFIYRHFIEVTHHEEFMQLTDERVLELLKSDQLQVQQEEDVYEAALKWLQFDFASREQHMCRILQHIRLALVDIEYIDSKIRPANHIYTCHKCQMIIERAVITKNDVGSLLTQVNRAQPQSVYVVGGRNTMDCQLKTMERYDFMQDVWEDAPSMRVARTAVGVGSLGGQLYVIGGECAPAESHDDTLYLRSVEVYNPVRKAWHLCSEIRIPRSFISLVSANGYLYAIGGEDRGCSYNTVERYDPIKNEWMTLPGMHRKRAGAGICVCDTKIYVAGGYDKSFHTDRASVECFDPSTHEWTFVAEMEKARSGLVLVAVDHYLYAIGGRSRFMDQYFNIAERYNTLSCQWTTIESMNTPRAWPGVAVLDGKIYAIGGFDGTNRLRSVEVYDPAKDTWTFVCSMRCPRAGCGSAVV